MARLLQANPGMKVYIVGHKDNQGALDYILDLSQRRADAVTLALVQRFRIAAGRLTAKGVGSLAPVASNDQEIGRAKIEGWNWLSNKPKTGSRPRRSSFGLFREAVFGNRQAVADVSLG